MMRVIIVIVMFCITCKGFAQTTKEWFNQKKTKLKYIEQQIVAFEMYANYLKKGYGVVQKGLATISDIKQGDFKIHSAHFDSLKIVNLSVRNDSNVADIEMLQLNTKNLNRSLLQFSNTSTFLQLSEKQYIKVVVNNLNRLCEKDNYTLQAIITDGTFSMTDDERLKQLYDLHRSVQDKYSFINAFKNEVQVIILSRTKENNDIESIRSLYNLK